MVEPGSIFRKRRLTPGQLRAVAAYRYGDSTCLLESKDSARATGAMYMGGFVIECLLKALLLERHPNLQSPVDPALLSRTDRGAYALLFSHELDLILDDLPEVTRKLRRLNDAEGKPLLPRFRTVCEQWTVYVRYSPKLAKREQAERFVRTIGEVKEWLKTL